MLFPEDIKSKPLHELPQYHFERGDFCKIIESTYPNFLDDLDECIGEHLEYFSIFRVEDEFYILHRGSGTMINWYKHLGRTNTCNKDLDLTGLEEFFILLNQDMHKHLTKLKNEKEREKLFGGVTMTEFINITREKLGFKPNTPILYNHSPEAPHLTQDELVLAFKIKIMLDNFFKERL